MARRTLEVVVAGDTKGLAKASRDAQKHLGTIDKSAKRTGDGLKRSGKDVRGFASVTSSGFSRIGVAASGAATIVGGAAVLMGKKIVTSASDIEESLTKNQVLFGKYAADVDKFSRTTAESFGISRAAALESAGVFGNLFSALDLGPQKSAKMSVALVKLASDMASFNNSSPEEALDAIRSGLVGETEPLRRFGVSINDAALRTEALRMGLVKTTKEALDPQTKALAVNALIFKQTEKAQGDFARTSDGVANQQRILKARFADLGSTLGKQLLPAVNEVTKGLNSFLTDMTSGKGVAGGFADGVKTAFGDAKDAIDDLMDSFKGFKASRGSTAEALGRTFAEAFEDIDWSGIANTMGEGIKGALNLSGDLADGISEGIKAAVEDVDGREVLGGLLRIFAEAINALFSPSFWIENFKNIFATVTIVIPVAKILRIPGASALYNWISKPFFNAIGKLAGAIVGLFGRVGSRAFGSFLATIEQFAPRVASAMLSVATGGVGAIRRFPGQVVAIAGRAINAIADRIGDGIGKVAGAMAKLVAGALRPFTSLGGRLATSLGKALAAGTQKIASWAGNFARAALEIGRKIVDGIVRGIKSTVGKISSAITGGISAAADKVNPFGEGIGKEVGTKFGAMPRGGSISGSLMGAKAGMRPIAVMGQRFGLGVSSGLRPGATTSSGNPSWHGTGEALDVSGPAAGMMGFAKMMRARFGSRLAELIYTPMGAGISNGRPHTFTGQVAKDHYDHVHVAMDLGKPGQGDGTGRRPRTGDGPGRAEQIFRFFKSKGFTDAQAAAWVGNLKQESGLSTTVVNPSSGATGLAQWLGGRLTGLKRKKNWRSLSTQLNYIWQELQGPEASAYAAIKKAKGLGPATHAIAFKFERMGRAEAAMGTRLAGARGAYNAFKGKGAGATTGRGRTGAARQAVERVSAFDAAIAPAEIAIAQATVQAGAEPVRGSATAARLSWALRDKRMILGKRIRKVRRALKRKGIKPATKLRLQQELSGLITEHAALGTQAKELVTPEALEPETIEPPDLPGPLDFLNRDIAQAGLTAGTQDDIAAATALRDFRAQQLAFARGGDPRTEAEFIEAFKSAEDALKQLTDTTQEQTDALKAHTDALTENSNQMKRQSDIAQAVQSTESFQIKKYLADILSGEIGGYGVARSFTPGAGREFAW